MEVVGRSVQRNRCPASAARCYTTAVKENSFQGKAFKRVQCFSYHIFRGGQDYPKLKREIAFQAEFSFKIGSRSFSSDHGDLVEAVVPYMGESISDGTLVKFLKKPGDRVHVDEPIAQIETDKVTIDVTSPEAGIIKEFVAKEGDTVEPRTKIAFISKSGEGGEDAKHTSLAEESPPPPPPPPLPPPPPPPPPPPREKEQVEKQIPKAEISLRKQEDKLPNPPAPIPTASEPQLPPRDRERRVPMTRLRKTIAQRLKDAQNTYVMLTTFNEIDMALLCQLSTMLIKRNFAEIEKEINTLAKKAIDGSLSIEEMTGDYGIDVCDACEHMQSAILGMHSIVNRPMVAEGNIVPRPMMYASLTYDHRLIDGREAVFFLRRIKDVVEDPRRLLIDV
ncbi:hypothetical protein RHGRI_009962 [Rhododendron griersonianum]|uniref:Dihydrolipoamide acetyltransferase component of pyruvate dehydrogenase complex n=1 Tax=Rhododendron griersonianum TaxID=479676 RepID=A0AAV6KH19_9ERIC|nr:hypothetical protein RHGRI_009962 [Rhododendron griersonianum]